MTKRAAVSAPAVPSSPEATPAGESPKPLRIACNGYVDARSGSIAAAGHQLLDALLARGHQIDFFSKPSFVHPVDLLDRHPNLRYRRAEDPLADRAKRLATRLVGAQLATPISLLQHRAFARAVTRAMRAAHHLEPFDAVLFIGTPAFGRVAGLRAVSWVQGGAGTDVRSLTARKDLLRRTETWWRRTLLRTYGSYRLALGRPDYSASDALICGSRWSRQQLMKELAAQATPITALPYPLDFAAFDRRERVPSRDMPLRVLWLGRIVPRKRLDLLLDAAARCEQGGTQVELTIVGSFGFAPGLRRLLAEYPVPSRLCYVERVPRPEVIGYLQAADVLCQPSDEEDFGMSVAEAMACGTPAIVGATNGTGDYLCPMSRRLEHNTVEDLRDALLEAVRRKRAGSLCDPGVTRAHAEATFDAASIAGRVEDLLRGPA